MSIAVMTHVWKHSRHKGSELLTLLAIADFAHDDGKNAYPSIESLSKKTRMTERNVQLVLKKLEESKELSIERNAGPHGCHLFTINFEEVKSFQGEKISPIIKRQMKERVTGSRGEKISGGEKISRVKNPALTSEEISPDPSLRDPLVEEKTPPIVPQRGTAREGTGKVIQAKAEHILEYLNTVHGRQLGNPSQIVALLKSKEFVQPVTMEDCKLVIDWLQEVERTEDPEAYKKYVNSITPFKPKVFERHRDKARQWEKDGRPSLQTRNNMPYMYS